MSEQDRCPLGPEPDAAFARTGSMRAPERARASGVCGALLVLAGCGEGGAPDDAATRVVLPAGPTAGAEPVRPTVPAAAVSAPPGTMPATPAPATPGAATPGPATPTSAREPEPAPAAAAPVDAVPPTPTAEPREEVAPETVAVPLPAEPAVPVRQPEPAGQAPTARLSAPFRSADAPFSVDFDATGSTDPDGSVVAHAWDLGDGRTHAGSAFVADYETPGTYEVRLTVTDDDGLTDTAVGTIEVLEPPVSPTLLSDADDAHRFLASVSFGGTRDGIDAAVGRDAADLLREQFDLPRTAYLPRVLRLVDGYGTKGGLASRAHATTFWRDAIEAEDQLRQRMVFALSQIIVVSDRGNRPSDGMAYYMDALGRNAFGNYRDLLEDITYSPAMADYLTYFNSRKGDPRTGRQPDENYARELLQLFTIGLEELEMDGTPRVGPDGRSVPTYGNDDVVGLAKVFTGLTRLRTGAGNALPEDNKRRALDIDDSRHSTSEKRFLGATIPENTLTADSIDRALDTVFAHPNVAPFVAHRLIQRFTASSPDPAHVRRVAEAFESGRFLAPGGQAFGTDRRGDLEATLAAVLLDESRFDPDASGEGHGKAREPVLNFVHWARAFDVSPVTPDNEYVMLYHLSNAADWMGQLPFQAPSVFNFYRPGFVAAGTESGEAGLSVPEFQILLSGNRTGYVNTMSEFVFDRTNGPDRERESLVPDYTDELALVEAPDALAEHLDALLLGGEMSDATRGRIEAIVPAIPIRTNTTQNEARDRFSRAAAAVLVAVTSPEYMIRR